MATPLYQGLTAQSTPDQIAAAYSQFAQAAGGDTQSAQTQAVDYLTNLGISAPTINQAYQQYLNPTFESSAYESSGPLTSDVATSLMQRSMTTGVPTYEFDRYGGYDAVQALYNAGGGSYTMSDIDPYALQNYANQVARTGIGNLSVLAATNTPLARSGITSMLDRGYGKDDFNKYFRVYADPTSLAGKNAEYLKEQADIQERIRRENQANPITAKTLYTDLTGKSNPGAIAAAYAQFAEKSGGDTAKNQQEATAYLKKLGVSDADIAKGYSFYKGSPTATAAATGTAGTTGATTATAGTATETASTEPLYKSLTSSSTADDIARAYYQFASGAGGDNQANQQEAVAYLQKLGISDPLIESGYKDYGEMAGLKSSFGLTDAATKPTTEGILSGFKYANEKGLDENTMKQVLGKDAFNTYKTGFADYAKTGIANILADKKLSFDEAREAVKFGRDYGYDAKKLADLTGADKKVFDAIYKNYDDTTNKIVDSVLGSEDVKTAGDQIERALALEKKYGFTDEDLAKATNLSVDQVKGYLNPVRNFDADYKKLLEDPNRSDDQTKAFLTASLQNPLLKQKLGDKLQPALDELNRPPRERILSQVEQQRNALGDKYYQGVFGDPEVMADVLEKKGVKSLTDLGEKEKFETKTADAQYTTLDGTPVQEYGGQFYITENVGDSTQLRQVPKDQVNTRYGRNEYVQEGDGGYNQFVPLTAEEQATIDKDGKYQQRAGTVVINKKTGDELTDTTHQLAYQRSGGGLKEKKNYLNVNFTKEGVPVLTASREKAGLGAAVQQAMPVLAMALPFMLPGVGTALSSGLASAGGSTLAAGSLANAALTQGIISGGLTTLGGGQFEKGFLGGAVSPVISAGIGSILPAGLDANATNAIKGAGTNVVKGALQGGNFKDLLSEGILGGLANYGLGETTKGLNLTPQQLNFATGIALPLLQGQKVSPTKLLTTLASTAQQQSKGKTP